MLLRIGFTGTRNGMSEAQKDFLTKIFKTYVCAVHHGDCIGADEQAHTIAKDLGHPTFLHPSTLTAYRAFCKDAHHIFPVKFPLERNKDIVNLTDILIATPKEHVEITRSGTWSTVRYAKSLLRTVLLIFPDGKSRLDV